MGNSAAKDSGELAVSEATQTLLEGPATSAFEEEGGVWDDMFASKDMDADAFYGVFSIADVAEMRKVQPGNLKLLGRKALSNISRFMETKHEGPPLPVVVRSIRILTRVLPAMLSDPALNTWCWKRQRLAFFLMYMERAEDDVGDEGEDDKEDGVLEKGGFMVKESEGSGGKIPVGKNDFPICFASVAIQKLSSLLSFPGFAVDDEASDWDDFYTPIPASHYGIREASLIWAPGVAVTDHNMREVSHLDTHRIELLRLLVSALSTPLYLEAPSKAKVEEVGRLGVSRLTEQHPSGPPAPSSQPGRFPIPALAAKTIMGATLENPVALLMASRHLPFATELFYSLLNVAAIDVNPTHASNAEVAGYSKKSRPMGWRLGFGARNAATDDKSPSLVEWCMRTLALLLRHGRPYRDLMEERGVFLKDDEPVTFGNIPRHVEHSIERDADFNRCRRCVYVIHSEEDLDRIALGLLRHLNDARLGKTRREDSPLSTHAEALMVFSAFVHENPRFVGRLAASEELARGTVVCVCHVLENAASSMIERDHVDIDQVSMGDGGEEDEFEENPGGRGGDTSNPEAWRSKPGGSWAEASASGARGGGSGGGRESGLERLPPGEDVGLLVLTSRLLLALSEDERLMSMLSTLPAAGRRGEFAATFLETEPGMNLADSVVTTAAWALARVPKGVSAAAPALAAVARNGCPYLEGGMRGHTADLMLDGIEINLRAAVLSETSAPGFAGGGEARDEDEGLAPEASSRTTKGCGRDVTSTGVVSLLLEGLATAVAFYYEDKSELVLSLVKRSVTPHTRGPTRSDVEPRRSTTDGVPGSSRGVANAAFGSRGGGVLHWLASRGGLLENGSEGRCSGDDPASLGPGEGSSPESVSQAALDSWFRVMPVCNPWEGWPMRRVLWPLVSTLTESTSQTGATTTTANGMENDDEEAMGQKQAAVDAEIRLLLSRVRIQILRPLGLWPPSWDGDQELGSDLVTWKPLALGGLLPRRMENGGEELQGKVGGGGVGGIVELMPRKGVVASALKAVRVSGGASVTPMDVSIRETSQREDAMGKAAAVAAATGTPFQPLHDPTERSGKWPGVASRGGNVSREARRMDWVSTGGDMVDGEPGGNAGSSAGARGLTRVITVEEPWQTIYLWSLFYLKTVADVPMFESRTVKLFEIVAPDAMADSTITSNNSNLSYHEPNDRSFFVDGQGSSDDDYPDHDMECGPHNGQEEEKSSGKRTSTVPDPLAASEEGSFMNAGEEGSGGKSGMRGLFRSSRGGVNGVKGARGGPVRAEMPEGSLDGMFVAGGGVRAEELV